MSHLDIVDFDSEFPLYLGGEPQEVRIVREERYTPHPGIGVSLSLMHSAKRRMSPSPGVAPLDGTVSALLRRISCFFSGFLFIFFSVIL